MALRRIHWMLLPAAIVPAWWIPRPAEVEMVPPTPVPLAESAVPAIEAVFETVSGVRSGPQRLSFEEAFVVRLPAEAEGHEVEFWIRQVPCRSDDAPYLAGRRAAGRDRSLRLLGIEPGRYAVEVRWEIDGSARVVTCEGWAPGRVVL